jgi:putative restriction endonuclease
VSGHPTSRLLLLYALGRFQRTGSSRMAFAEAEGDLRRLLEELGPLRSTSPGYPFHHLTTDGLRVVGTLAGTRSPGPNLGALRAGAIGALAADFAGALEHDSRLFGSVVRAILDANFPATMHQDILDATGIALEGVELADVTVAPRGQRRRDPSFRELVLLA